MWSGRFRQPLNSEFEAWQRSFPFDQRLLTQEIACSSAHARALGKIGVLSADELAKILQGLKTIEKSGSDSHYLQDSDAEDVHHFVEKRLAELIGDTGYKLHSGRSRNEQIATDMRLFVRASIATVQQLIAGLLVVIAERSEKAGTAAMPAHTHMQAAEPVLVSHWLLAYAEMFLRDHARLSDCLARVNQCPLGSGAVAGATLPLDRQAIAKELGFTAPTKNSMDATSDRDFAIEFVQALSLLAVHLSRWAEEFIIFSTREFGFVRLPESYSTGSSAMPQKKNPDALELVRGNAGRIMGSVTTLLTVMKGLPLAYNKDLQETQQPVFDAADTAIQCLKTAIGFMGDVEFDFARMQSSAGSGFMNAMAAATYLVNKGVPFRKAHEQIGNAVRFCLDKDCELQDLQLEELRQFGPAFDADFYAAVTIEAVLACHDVIGGTNVNRVRAAIAALQEQIAGMRGEVHAHA